MKKLLLFLTLVIILTIDLAAQSVPQGMRYQAVVRDLEGKVLQEMPLVVKVELLSSQSKDVVYYLETHRVSSTPQGLLNFTIGEGKSTIGDFENIPWSRENIWVKISMKSKENDHYEMINSSQLYSVPYAYFAENAGEIVEDVLMDNDSSRSINPGSNSINWRLDGNKNAQYRNNGNPILGTTDENALVFVTNNVPRMILAVAGDANVKHNLDVDGNMNVDQQVEINAPDGSTLIGGPTTVDQMSPTHLTGTLTVDKASEIGAALTVENMSPTHLTGTLDVDKDLTVEGSTTLNDSFQVTNGSPAQFAGGLVVDEAISVGDALTVGNMAPSHLTGTLDVDKELTVGESTTLNDALIVTGESASHLSGSLEVDESTTLGGALIVENMSPTHLTGTLEVDKTLNVGEGTTLNDGLDVDGNTDLSGELNVDEAAFLENSLTVENMSPTHLTGTLLVDENLNVDQNVLLNQTLDVLGMNPTHLSGTLTVDQLQTLVAGMLVSGTGVLGPGGGDLAFFENTNGGSADGIGIQIQKDKVSKLNNFMTFYRGNGATVAGRIEGYQFGDIDEIPIPTSDEIWTAVCIAIADYNPVTFTWTQLATSFNAFSYLWNNTTTPSFDIPDIPPFAIPDVPSLEIPDVPAFVIPDVPGFAIPDIPGVTIPDVPSLNVGPYLCVTINECFCFCDITQIFGDWDCCCVDEEVCVIPAFTLFGGLTLPDFPGIPIPDFPGIPIPDFPGIPIPDFPGITIPDFPGLVIPEVPSINLASQFGTLPTIPTFSDILQAEGICPDEDIFDLDDGYFRRLADWAFEHRLQSLVTINPVGLAGSALAWATETAVIDNGVIYGSKGADYAEYLPKLNASEQFLKGEIVGVHNGRISKDTRNADQILAVSSNPVILGNLPDSDIENYEKIAFLGQVALYVQGPVNIGDYIIPSGRNNGIGKAVPAEMLTAEMLSQVLGTSWSSFDENVVTVVNASIGLRPNEVAVILKKQGVMEKELQSQIDMQKNQSNFLTSDLNDIKQYVRLRNNK